MTASKTGKKSLRKKSAFNAFDLKITIHSVLEIAFDLKIAIHSALETYDQAASKKLIDIWSLV